MTERDSRPPRDLPVRRGLAAVLVTAAVLAACGGATPTSTASSAVNESAAAATGAPASAAAGSAGPATPIPDPTAAPLGDRLVATITVAAGPCAMAVDGTSVWVTGSSEVDRVDPATNTVADRVTVDASPCGIAVGADGRIWVAILGTGSVVAIDPSTRQVTGRLDHVGPQLWDLKAGFDSIWVVDRTAKAVLRIDPKTAKVTATIPVGPNPSGLAVMPQGVWVSDDTDGQVRRIDPATNKVAASAPVGGAPSWFADDGAANLVIAERGGGNVVPLDLLSGAQEMPVAGFNEPLDGTVYEGKAWIPEGSGRRVGVLDLGTAGARVMRYALPGAVNPFVAEPAFGDIWVLDFGGATIWRIHP